jgi:hypothetical protein
MEIMIVLATLLTIWAVWAGLAGWIKRSGRQWYWKPVPAICASFAGMIVLVVGAALGGYGNRVEPVATASGPVAVTPVPPMAAAETDVPVAEAKPTEPSVSAPLQPLASATAKAPVLDLTPAQYVEKLNWLMKDLGYPYDEQVTLSNGSVNDTLQGDLGKYVSYFIVISKDTGKVLLVNGTGAGDGTEASGYEILLLGSAVMAAAMPDMSHREMLLALSKLPVSGGKGVTDTVQYSVKTIKGLGVQYTVEPVAQSN